MYIILKKVTVGVKCPKNKSNNQYVWKNKAVLGTNRSYQVISDIKIIYARTNINHD